MPAAGTRLDVALRMPSWLAPGTTVAVTVGGAAWPSVGAPGSYLHVSPPAGWAAGATVLSFSLPMPLVAYEYTGASTLPPFSRWGYMVGPVLLAAQVRQRRDTEGARVRVGGTMSDPSPIPSRRPCISCRSVAACGTCTSSTSSMRHAALPLPVPGPLAACGSAEALPLSLTTAAALANCRARGTQRMTRSSCRPASTRRSPLRGSPPCPARPCTTSPPRAASTSRSSRASRSRPQTSPTSARGRPSGSSSASGLGGSSGRLLVGTVTTTAPERYALSPHHPTIAGHDHCQCDWPRPHALPVQAAEGVLACWQTMGPSGTVAPNR